MQCFPSQKRLADDTCLTERTVRTVIASLTERGMLSKVERRRLTERGPQTSSRCISQGKLHRKRKSFPQASNRKILPPINRKSAHPTTGNLLQHQAEIISGLTTFEPSLNHQLTLNPSPGARDTIGLRSRFWRAYPHAKGRSSKPATFEQWRKLPQRNPQNCCPAHRERYGREGREPRQDWWRPGHGTLA